MNHPSAIEPVKPTLAILAALLLAPPAAVHAAAATASTAPAEASLIEGSIKAGWLKGLRAVELIRADILSITLDAGLTGALEPAQYRAAKVPKQRAKLEPFAAPEPFSITSTSDADFREPVRPLKVGQCSYEGHNSVHHGKSGLPSCTIFHTDCFLFLPKPMKSGHSYTVTVTQPGGKDARLACTATLAYDDTKTATKVLKVNQVAYSALAKQRFAYLGWWAGSAGKVDYAAIKEFEVLDEATGRIALSGGVKLRSEQEKLMGEDVYEMDLAALPPGRYHVRVPGLGCSDAFAVGGAGVHELYYHTLRAFFHQRCGQEFKEPWTWAKKPACHSEILASGCLPTGSPFIIPEAAGGTMPQTTEPKTGEKPRHFQGGYHDAADYDVFSYHLPAVSDLLTLHELFPDAFGDGDLDLPESGNKIPDLLDEAAWGLSAFLELQHPNGAVPLGRGNLQDGISQTFEKGYNQWNKNGIIPPHGLLPPKGESTPVFAAVAAQFARVFKPFDAALAGRYLTAAEKAFAYAATNTPPTIHAAYTTAEFPLKKSEGRNWEGAWFGACNWAAAELLRATGKPEYAAFIQAHEKQVTMMNAPYAAERAGAIAQAEGVEPKIRDRCRRELLGDSRVQTTATMPYRMSFAYWEKNSGWWGSMQGINAADRFVRAYALSKDQKHLDALSLNADWHLGCNPRSETWISNLGHRFPRRPEISHFLYEKPAEELGGKTVRGISLYGLGPALPDWFGPWPMHRSRRDVWADGAEVYSEFTVPQTLSPAALAYGTLYALEKLAGRIPPHSKPNPLDR